MKKILVAVLVVGAFLAFVKFTAFSHSSTCTAMQTEVETLIAQSRACTSSDDCSGLELSCPFPCAGAVHEDKVSTVLSAVNTYNRSCMYTCPECPKGVKGIPSCIEGTCQVVGGKKRPTFE